MLQKIKQMLFLFFSFLFFSFLFFQSIGKKAEKANKSFLSLYFDQSCDILNDIDIDVDISNDLNLKSF